MDMLRFWLIIHLFPVAAAAQAFYPSPERDGGWVAIGAGLGSPYGKAIVATANFGRERVLQVGLRLTSDFDALDQDQMLSALHLGGGLSRVGRWTRVALTAGPALVFNRNEDLDESRALGAVISGQAVVTPIPAVGLGLDAYVIPNGLTFGYGVGFTLVFERHK